MRHVEAIGAHGAAGTGRNTKLIMLAAGRGTRMDGFLPVPKPLADVCGEPLLQRTMRQFHEGGIRDMILVTGYEAQRVGSTALSCWPDTRVIHNARYAEDRNILSLLLAMRQVPAGSGCFVAEGDVLLTENAALRVSELAGGDRSVWTACGNFRPGQKGGVLLPDERGEIREIRYSEWSAELAHWCKNLGVIYVAPGQVPVFAGLLDEYAARSLDYYFMTPWRENLEKLPARLLDLGHDSAATFNTPEEYAAALRLVAGDMVPIVDIRLVEVKKLRHIEDYDRERVRWLADKIKADGRWLRPLAVSAEGDWLVMDGQHRMEAARLLGLSRVPAILLEYENVPVRSLRPEYEVSHKDIMERALSGNIYPYKTAKHELPLLPNCDFSLDELR